MGLSPITGNVNHVINAAEAQKKLDAYGFDAVAKDKKLEEEIGCVQWFRGDMPESLARVDQKAGGVGFVIRGLPTGTWIAEGKGESVAMAVKDNPYVEVVRHLVTDECYAPDSLIRVKRFPVRQGPVIVQLEIGKFKKASPEKQKQMIQEEMERVERIFAKWAWPEYKKKALEELEKNGFVESVQICRFYLDGKRVLKAEKISRGTEVDEQIDAARDLDPDHWSDTTDSAIGFISLNEGKDWDALFVDLREDEIGYSIKRLNGFGKHYGRSLRVYH
jgi:hypothetical protein